MKDDKLRLRYPVFPNIIKFVVYGCICTLAAVFALYLSGLQPQTFRGKILCIVGFTALLVILVFTVMALLNAARNIIL